MKGEKAICLVCGKEFVKKTARSKVCSRSCATNLSRKDSKKEYEKKCPVCGSIYKTTNSRSKYCSTTCAYEAQLTRKKLSLKKVVHEPINCENCGAEFVPKNSRARFCCDECRIKYRPTADKPSAEGRTYPPRTCEQCGKNYIPLSGSTKYCSDECRTEANRIRNSRPGSSAAPAQKAIAKLNRAAKRWATMSWDEVVQENMYYGLRYPDSQRMAHDGTLPEDYGLKRKKAKR